MRKIISILVTLGIVLGLTLMAAPTAAQVCTATDTATVPPFCATQVDEHNIQFISPVTLLAGNDRLSFEFGAGTTFETFILGDIQIRSTTTFVWTNVALADIDATAAPSLSFLIPATMFINAGDTVDVIIDKVRNPNVAVTTPFKLLLDYKLVCCDPVVFDCADYVVVPLYHTLGFHFDFDKTYTGIAEDFIPPFKACGQDTYGYYNATVGWMNTFDLILRADIPGCLPPCTNATMWFVLTECPAGEVVSFMFDMLGTVGGPFGFTLTHADIGTKFALPNVIMPPPTPDVLWESNLHFSSPGEYEICFYLECPEVPCAQGAQIVAEKCMPVKVHQWKDAYKIPLYRKWNLISLPLVPLADPPPADVFASYALASDIISVWHYDRTGCPAVGTWKCWSPQSPTACPAPNDLANMEDGESYWVYIVYNSTHPAGMAADGVWVWGTPRPVPPNAPSAYEVCKGWNMVGYTDTTWFGGFPGPGMWDANYLWNWYDILTLWADYGAVYGWDPVFQTWWSYLPSFGWFPWLYLGEGYWISFEYDGMIYPP